MENNVILQSPTFYSVSSMSCSIKRKYDNLEVHTVPNKRKYHELVEFDDIWFSIIKLLEYKDIISLKRSNKYLNTLLYNNPNIEIKILNQIRVNITILYYYEFDKIKIYNIYTYIGENVKPDKNYSILDSKIKEIYTFTLKSTNCGKLIYSILNNCTKLLDILISLVNINFIYLFGDCKNYDKVIVPVYNILTSEETLLTIGDFTPIADIYSVKFSRKKIKHPNPTGELVLRM